MILYLCSSVRELGQLGFTGLGFTIGLELGEHLRQHHLLMNFAQLELAFESSSFRD